MCRPLGSWILEVGARPPVSLYFIFPGICTLSLTSSVWFYPRSLDYLVSGYQSPKQYQTETVSGELEDLKIHDGKKCKFK
ncbi:hypothetical protein STEG23_017741, partial [Scotinomys teguina]